VPGDTLSSKILSKTGALLQEPVQLFAPSSRSTSKCSPLWRHFLWLLALNACGSILSIVAWVARYQQKVFSFASKEAKKGSAEYWSGQV